MPLSHLPRPQLTRSNQCLVKGLCSHRLHFCRSSSTEGTWSWETLEGPASWISWNSQTCTHAGSKCGISRWLLGRVFPFAASPVPLRLSDYSGRSMSLKQFSSLRRTWFRRTWPRGESCAKWLTGKSESSSGGCWGSHTWRKKYWQGYLERQEGFACPPSSTASV